MMKELGRILDIEGGDSTAHQTASFTPVLLQQQGYACGKVGRRKTLRCLLASASGHQMDLPETMHSLVAATTYGTDRCFMRVPLEALVLLQEGQALPAAQPQLIHAGHESMQLTMESLFENGIGGIMRPLSSVQGISAADAPFFLFRESIHCIVLDLSPETPDDVVSRLSGSCMDDFSAIAGLQECRSSASASEGQQQQLTCRKRRRNRSSQKASVRLEDTGLGPVLGTDGRSHFPRRAAMFENMCGSALVYGYQLYDKSNAAINSRLDECVCCARQAKKRLGSSDSMEVFSIHGNLVLRKDPSGTVVSFKVQHMLNYSCRDASHAQFILKVEQFVSRYSARTFHALTKLCLHTASVPSF
jgi:hypothetical protein